MLGLKTIRSLRAVAAGHAFVQNLRRGHYETTFDIPTHDRVRLALTELAVCLWPRPTVVGLQSPEPSNATAPRSLVSAR
jgi:hypothetical protein